MIIAWTEIFDTMRYVQYLCCVVGQGIAHVIVTLLWYYGVLLRVGTERDG
jgi:hypothetical protein